MSFLTDEKLTFHRFSDGRISFDRENKLSNNISLSTNHNESRRSSNVSRQQITMEEKRMIPTTLEKNLDITSNNPIWTTKSSLEYNNSASATPDHTNSKYYLSSQTSTITSNNDTIGRGGGDTTANTTETDSIALQNGSKLKLINVASNEHLDDQPTKQVSWFFCLLLNFLLMMHAKFCF
jgi:hypothetical protein